MYSIFAILICLVFAARTIRSGPGDVAIVTLLQNDTEPSKITLETSKYLTTHAELNPNLVAPSEAFQQTLVLIEPDVYLLYWSSNQTHIWFEVHAKTNGWFTFGFKSNQISDFVIAHINDDGTAHFSDRHTLPYLTNKALLDAKQDWIPVYMTKSKEYTIFKFVRKLVICDDEEGGGGGLGEDLEVIVGRNMTVIYAIGEVFNGEIVYYALKKGQKEFELVKNMTEFPRNTCGNDNDVNGIFEPKSVVNFNNHIELAKNRFHLFWNVTSEEFIGEMHVKTSGWVSLGFSPRGGIQNSDILVGWISNEKVYFYDCYVNNSKIVVDMNNDIKLLYFSEINNSTIIRFKRNIISCDREDKTIEMDSPHLLFSWGLKDPVNFESISEVVESQNWGSIQVDLFSKSYQITDASSSDKFIETLDFSISHVAMPSEEAFFYCKAFEIPKNLTTKRHIFKWEILLPKINREKIRKVQLFECQSKYQGTPTIYPGDCYSNTQKLEYCFAPLFVWSHGSNPIAHFPDDTGYPIGTGADYTFVVLEILYGESRDSNKMPQQMLGYFDDVTLRVHMTKKLRPNDLGVFTLGTESEPIGILIPPNVSNFQIESYCYNTCIKEKFASVNNLTVVMAFPNTNQAGVEIMTNIVRNRQNVGYLHYNEFYNPNFLNYLELRPRINITQNDNFITKCTYSTLDRTSLTLGGTEEKKEVCFHAFFYYPRIPNFKYCGSFPTFDDQLNMFKELKSDGLVNFTEHRQNFDLTSKIDNDQLTVLYSAYDSLVKLKSNFSPTITNKLFNLYNSSKFYSSCEDGKLFRSQLKLEVDKSLVNKIDKIKNKFEECRSLLASEIFDDTATKINKRKHPSSPNSSDKSSAAALTNYLTSNFYFIIVLGCFLVY